MLGAWCGGVSGDMVGDGGSTGWVRGRGGVLMVEEVAPAAQVGAQREQ